MQNLGTVHSAAVIDLLIYLALFTLGSPAEARADAAWREEIVVTATRTPQPRDAVPAWVAVLSAEELARTPGVGLDDQLRRNPGFRLFRRASSTVAHPTVQGVSLRGLGATAASRSLVLLDGVPVNDPFGTWVPWHRLPRLTLSRVEIAPAAAGSLWGSGALAGAIHLVTRRPNGRLTLEASAGDRETVRLDLASGFRRQRSDAFFDLRGLATEGYRTVAAEQRGTIDVPARSEHQSFYGRFARDLNAATVLRLRALGSLERRVNGTPQARNEASSVAVTAGLAAIANARTTWSVLTTAQRNRFENQFTAVDDARGTERPVLDQFDVFSDSLRVDAQLGRQLVADHRLTGGIEVRLNDAGVGEDFFFSAAEGRFLRRRRAGGDERLLGAFVQHEAQLGARLTLQAALRIDHFAQRDGLRREVARDGAGGSDGTVLLVQRFADRDHTELVPRLAVRWAMSEHVDLLAGAYGGFRAPSANELYRPFRVGNDITAANAVLDPERLRGGEVGLSARGRRTQLRATAFWNEVADAIANATIGFGPGQVAPCGFVPTGGTCRVRSNVGTVRVRGVEAALDVRLGQGLSFDLGYTLQDARFAGDTGTLAGLRLPQVPRHQATLGVEWQQGAGGALRDERLAARLELRYAGPQPEDDLGTRRLDDTLTLGVLLRRPLSRGLDGWLSVDNVTDETIEVGRSANGLVTVGLPQQIVAGIRWRLPD